MRILIVFFLTVLLFPASAQAWSPEGCEFNIALPPSVQTQHIALDPQRAQAFTRRGLLAPEQIYGVKANGVKVSCLIYGRRHQAKQLALDLRRQLDINTKEKGIADWRIDGLSASGSGVHNSTPFYIALFYGASSQMVLIVVKNKKAFDQLHASIKPKY